MKTKEQILAYGGGENCNAIDGRDRTRLAVFFPIADWPKLGLSAKEGATHEPVELTREAVIDRLKHDLDFAFTKALDQRGISSSLMWDVIKMWMWVLDDELADFPDDRYAQYGLPLFKAVAVKYNLPNPIGDDDGDEAKYASD